MLMDVYSYTAGREKTVEAELQRARREQDPSLIMKLLIHEKSRLDLATKKVINLL